MSRLITEDTLFSILRRYESRVKRLEKIIGQVQIIDHLPGVDSNNENEIEPSDGQVVVIPLDETNGISWAFRYNSESSSSYKWEFIGGPPLLSEAGGLSPAAEGTTSSTSYTSTLAGTSGFPSLTPLFNGEYYVEVGATIRNDTQGANSYMSYEQSGNLVSTTTADDWAFNNRQASTTVSERNSGSRIRKQTLLGNVDVNCIFRVDSGTLHSFGKWLKIIPIRVG